MSVLKTEFFKLLKSKQQSEEDLLKVFKKLGYEIKLQKNW